MNLSLLIPLLWSECVALTALAHASPILLDESDGFAPSVL